MFPRTVLTTCSVFLVPANGEQVFQVGDWFGEEAVDELVPATFVVSSSHAQVIKIPHVLYHAAISQLQVHGHYQTSSRSITVCSRAESIDCILLFTLCMRASLLYA